MGCSSSKLCLYSQCAAARVIGVCFAVLFPWQGAGRERGVSEQGERALAAGSPDLVTSVLWPWVRGAGRRVAERLCCRRARAATCGAGLGAEGPGGRLPPAGGSF